MIKPFRSWWTYTNPEDKSRREVSISGSEIYGFTKEEAETIGPQVIDASFDSLCAVRDQDFIVAIDGQKFYVYIDNRGAVQLPRLKSEDIHLKLYGKTLDNSKILEFRTKTDWDKED